MFGEISENRETISAYPVRTLERQVRVSGVLMARGTLEDSCVGHCIQDTLPRKLCLTLPLKGFSTTTLMRTTDLFYGGVDNSLGINRGDRNTYCRVSMEILEGPILCRGKGVLKIGKTKPADLILVQYTSAQSYVFRSQSPPSASGIYGRNRWRLFTKGRS